MTATTWARSAAAAALLVPAIVVAQYTVEVLHSPAVPSPFSFGWGAGGGQQVGHTNIFLSGPSNALLWNGTAGSFVNLHPAGFDASYAMAAEGGRQVGWRELHFPGRAFATMWAGSAKGWTDLHNKDYFDTRALGIGGAQQVGLGRVSAERQEALLWHGTPESVVNLHPSLGYESSRADDTDGSQQVGKVQTAPKGISHAALWSGTSESFVDLNPDGFAGSEARGVAGGEQVGKGNFGGNGHALLWFGSSQNYVDLNPGPNNEWGSEAEDTNGRHQVGLVRAVATGFQFHAARWTGTPGSFFDLHNLLPSQFIGSGAESRAMGIDEFGNIVGWAADLSDGGRAKAVLWRPVPEPCSAIALGGMLLLLAARCHRRAWISRTHVLPFSRK
ncbi:MAG: hypothetical protein M3R13_08740 [Armatimonadota bacterium]|nr:hypothetical protein [Armatimonadota bacterium]